MSNSRTMLSKHRNEEPTFGSFVQPRKETLYDVTTPIYNSMDNRTSFSYPVKISVMAYHCSYFFRIVSLVGVQRLRRTWGNDSIFQSRFDGVYVVYIGRKEDQRQWQTILIYDGGEFGCLSTSVCRITSHAISSVYVFYKRRIYALKSKISSRGTTLELVRNGVRLSKDVLLSPNHEMSVDGLIRRFGGTKTSPWASCP